MSKRPLSPYRELARIAEILGYRWIRRKGNQNILRNADVRVVVIPDHGSRQIGRSLPRKILREMNLSPDEYARLLEDLS